MLSKALKITLTTAALTTAFVGLLWTTMADGTEYYKHVDEVMTELEVWQDKRLQVHGYAADVRRRPDSLDYRFEIHNNGYVIHAEYTGIVPDTFKNEAEVVASGRLDGNVLIVESDGIMAKCPSKYEPKPVLEKSVISSGVGSSGLGVPNN